MRRPRARLLALPPLLLAAALSGCDRQPLSTAVRLPQAPPGTSLAELICTADVHALTLVCAPSGTGARRDVLVVGGQAHYVRLVSSGTAYDSVTHLLSSSVTVQNLLAQAMGTADGTTPDTLGVVVFFSSGPSSGVTVANASGVDAFTASNQPYFRYLGVGLAEDSLLSSGETSAAKTWQFQVNGAATFTFTVYVQAEVASSSASFVSLRAISAGTYHTCGIDSAGKAYCWGNNGAGQLGDGTLGDRSTPVAVSQGEIPSAVTLTSIAAGSSKTCAIGSDDKAYCWGDNSFGALGDGTTTNRSAPVAVSQGAIPPGVTLTTIAEGGNEHTCAIGSDGKAYCWGNNPAGELGDATQTDQAVPVAVNAGDIPSGVTLTRIAAGSDHTCAIGSDGKAYCWGWGGEGQLGNDWYQATTPVVVYAGEIPSGVTLTRITAGRTGTCAIGSNGKAYCWGGNYSGSTIDYGRTPTAVSPGAIPSGVTLTSITAGANENVCAIASDGKAYCWGVNWAGQLGNGTVTDYEATAVAVSPGAIPLGVRLLSITAGFTHTCALSSAGPAFCWGYNNYVQVGDGTNTDRDRPVYVASTR